MKYEQKETNLTYNENSMTFMAKSLGIFCIVAKTKLTALIYQRCIDHRAHLPIGAYPVSETVNRTAKVWLI